MKLSLWFLTLLVTLMAPTGCQNEPDRPAAAGSPSPSAAVNTPPLPEPLVPPAENPTATGDYDDQAGQDSLESASEAGGSSGLTKEFLVRQKFVLVQVNEADYSGGQDLPTPTLEFDEGFKVSGRICNNYHGSGELLDDVLSVRAVASTRMLCPDSNLSQLETKFFQMLESGVTLSMDGDRLYLKQGDDTLVFKAQTDS